MSPGRQGHSLYRTAMTALLKAAREVRDNGTLSYIDSTIATPELSQFMRS